MRQMMQILAPALLALAALLPGWALARDAALIAVAEDYNNLTNNAQAPDVSGLAADLSAAGFATTTITVLKPVETWKAVEQFRKEAATAERVFIFVAGHVVHTRRDTWLLTRNAMTNLTDVNVGRVALPLGALLDIADAHSGQAVVMVAPSRLVKTGPGIAAGPELTAPPGVTLLTGPAKRLVRLARETVLVPGTALQDALTPPPNGVTVSGFLSNARPFLPGAGLLGPRPPSPPRSSDAELAFWNVVVELDTPSAYRAYLQRYPSGRFATVAARKAQGGTRPGIVDQSRELARAEAAEARLRLDRAERREIQRNLALLDHNPRGIDGIFGPGTRAAIRAWQAANGYAANGYLTGAQVQALDAAGKARAEALAAEAAAKQAEEERRDTAYWRDTGRGASEAGLRSYLDRYPEGLFAEIARARLSEIEADRRDEAAVAEGPYWRQTRRENSVAGYQLYLERYPTGRYVDEAKSRIQGLREEGAIRAAAKEEERRVVPNGVLRLLVENRLAAAGHDPGPIDGKFDKATRHAIRQFQKGYGLEVSGFITESTMFQLLTVL